MLLIDLDSSLKLEVRKAWSFGDKSHPSDMTVYQVGFIKVYSTNKASNGRFHKYIRRFINEDFEFHPLLRREAKKYRSKLRADHKRWNGEEIESLHKQIRELQNEKYEVEKKARVLRGIVDGMNMIKAGKL